MFSKTARLHLMNAVSFTDIKTESFHMNFDAKEGKLTKFCIKLYFLLLFYLHDIFLHEAPK